MLRCAGVRLGVLACLYVSDSLCLYVYALYKAFLLLNFVAAGKTQHFHDCSFVLKCRG